MGFAAHGMGVAFSGHRRNAWFRTIGMGEIMKHTEMMGLSRHKRPQPFHNGLRCLLVLTIALVVAGFGRLDAEERTPATTEHDAVDAETVTAWPRRITID